LKVQQIQVKGRGALQVTFRKPQKKGVARIFVETYLHPHRLSNYYGASFSPTIWPGQTLRARVMLPPGNPETVRAGLFVREDHHHREYAQPGALLHPGQWTELNYAIPPLHNALINQAGLVLHNLDDMPWDGDILIDWLDWSGAPKFSTDFSMEKEENGAISQWTYLRGYWRLQEDSYHGSGPEISETYSGDVAWQDYNLSVRLTPLMGDHHLILARVQGALRCYALGLGPQGLELYKNHHGYRLLAHTPFDWQPGSAYHLHLNVKGVRLTGWVDGGPELNWEDDAPFLHGQIGLANFPHCHTRFHYLELS
jgi:hypothetical protein